MASACDMYRRHCARLVLSVMQGGFPAIRGTELSPRTALFGSASHRAGPRGGAGCQDHPSAALAGRGQVNEHGKAESQRCNAAHPGCGPHLALASLGCAPEFPSASQLSLSVPARAAAHGVVERRGSAGTAAPAHLRSSASPSAPAAVNAHGAAALVTPLCGG